MASRDCYTTPITCPKCKQSGKLHLSEEGDGHVYMRAPDIQIEKVEGDFLVKGTQITCKKCRTKFLHS